MRLHPARLASSQRPSEEGQHLTQKCIERDASTDISFQGLNTTCRFELYIIPTAGRCWSEAGYSSVFRDRVFPDGRSLAWRAPFVPEAGKMAVVGGNNR